MPSVGVGVGLGGLGHPNLEILKPLFDCAASAGIDTLSTIKGINSNPWSQRYRVLFLVPVHV